MPKRARPADTVKAQPQHRKRQRVVELRSLEGSNSDWHPNPFASPHARLSQSCSDAATHVLPVRRKRKTGDAARGGGESVIARPSSSNLRLDDTPRRVLLDDGVAGGSGGAQRTARSDEDAVVGSRGWRPGRDTKGWCGKNLKLQPQTEVVIANANINLQNVPDRVLTEFLRYCDPVGDKTYTSLRDRVLSALMKIPARTLHCHTTALRKSNYNFTPPHGDVRHNDCVIRGCNKHGWFYPHGGVKHNGRVISGCSKHGWFYSK